MDDSSLQPININILYTLNTHPCSHPRSHNLFEDKESFKSSVKRLRTETTAESDKSYKKRVTFPSEGTPFFERCVDLVMAEADRKEKNEVVEKVGSASTWGRRERDRFKIPAHGVQVDAVELIGKEWFDFDGLDATERESILLEYNADNRVYFIADFSRIRCPTRNPRFSSATAS
jgi:hypothetical protein